MLRAIAREVLRQFGPAREYGQIGEEELVHEGILGLLEARQNFKVEKGVPWLAFAAYRVRGAMLDALRRLPLVRLPQEARQKVKELQAAGRELLQASGESDPVRLAEHLGWSLAEVHEVAQLTPALVTIGDPDGEDDEDAPLPLVLTDTLTPDPEMAAARRELAELVRDCLEKIPQDQDRLVLLGRVVHGLKLRELAETIGCSIENVRLVQKKVEAWMRSCLARQGVTGDGLLHLFR